MSLTDLLFYKLWTFYFSFLRKVIREDNQFFPIKYDISTGFLVDTLYQVE
jgi:hypothetical protein